MEQENTRNAIITEGATVISARGGGGCQPAVVGTAAAVEMQSTWRWEWERICYSPLHFTCRREGSRIKMIKRIGSLQYGRQSRTFTYPGQSVEQLLTWLLGMQQQNHQY